MPASPASLGTPAVVKDKEEHDGTGDGGVAGVADQDGEEAKVTDDLEAVTDLEAVATAEFIQRKSVVI